MIFYLQCSPTERVVMKDGGVGDVGQLGEVPHDVVESVARRPHLHQVACLLGGQVRPLPAHGVIELATNILKVPPQGSVKTLRRFGGS